MRPSRSWSSTAAAWRGRSGACACRSSARAPAEGPRRRDAGGRPRRRAADDEHPARRARGRREREGVPARGGPAPLRPGGRDPLSELPARVAALTATAGGGAPRGPAGELEQVSSLVRFEADRAQQWFERGMQLVPLLDRRSAACVLAMAGIYHRLLQRIEGDPERVLRERVSLSTREKAWVAARALAGTARERGPGDRGGRRPGGDHGGARLAGAGAEVTLVEVRRDSAERPTRFTRRSGDGQRPARVPALLHHLPSAAARLGSESLVRVQPRLEIPVLAPGTSPTCCAADRCRPHCSSRADWPATATCRCASGSGRRARRSR